MLTNVFIPSINKSIRFVYIILIAAQRYTTFYYKSISLLSHYNLKKFFEIIEI